MKRRGVALLMMTVLVTAGAMMIGGCGDATTGEEVAVTEAVESAKRSAVGKIVASAIIANPHDETMKLVETSAKRNKFM